MKKEWQILRPDPNAVENLAGILKCHPAIAAILVNRNIASPEDASNFLSASLNHLSPPFTLKDMDAGVDRILKAINRREKILIFGDYDVDGVTATTILLEFFRSVGADVSYYIPHRITEGYGLQGRHIMNCALAKKIDLIITVDCGSGSYDAVAAANAAGIDVIITDHHVMPDTIPPAVAVINPMRSDCPSGFDDLAGVGVAFYLLICLRKQLRDENFWKDRPEPNLKSICDLVALGTLADMVPLTNNNRILAKTGLDIISTSPRSGMKALMRVCGIDKRSVNSEDVVFGLAPRLNSAGRIERASLAVELLMTKSMDDAGQIANSLNHMNRKRRSIETEMMAQIEDHLKANPSLLRKNTLVLAHPDWHSGILGIVAARVVKKYFCPVVLITTADGVGIGSARSIPGVNLYDGLCACAGDLESFGGHSMAAGLKIRTEKIDRFESEFENVVGDITKPDDFIPKIYIDYELAFDTISEGLIDEIESLNPFGTGNPEPIFMARNITVVSWKIVGKHHRRMLLKQSGGNTGTTFHAIHFNANTGIPVQQGFDRIAFRLRWNRWNGTKTPQIIIEEIETR
jgi:single-stranded-DNA-specific exonuclease